MHVIHVFFYHILHPPLIVLFQHFLFYLRRCFLRSYHRKCSLSHQINISRVHFLHLLKYKVYCTFAARCYASAAYAVMQCLSVCLSVRLSVPFMYSVETNKHIIKKILPSDIATPF